MRQLNKIVGGLYKSAQDTGQNTRRLAAKLPFIERKLDKISGEQGFEMEFTLTNRSHSVLLSVYIKPENCCECEPGALPDATRDGTGSQASYVGGADGVAHPAIWHRFDQTGNNLNLGYNSPFFYPFYNYYYDYAGFTNDTTNGGITIPVNGFYSVSYRESVGSYPASDGYAIISIRRNGIIISKRSYTIGHGLNVDSGTSMLLYAQCIPLFRGDILDGWFEGSGVGFLADPQQTQGSLTVNLIGLGWGAITGVVRDTVSGAPIQGVTVSYSMGFGGSTTTDQYGVYLFSQIRPGSYNFTFTMANYITNVMAATITFGQITNMDAPLTPV